MPLSAIHHLPRLIQSKAILSQFKSSSKSCLSSTTNNDDSVDDEAYSDNEVEETPTNDEYELDSGQEASDEALILGIAEEVEALEVLTTSEANVARFAMTKVCHVRDL